MKYRRKKMDRAMEALLNGDFEKAIKLANKVLKKGLTSTQL